MASANSKNRFVTFFNHTITRIITILIIPLIILLMFGFLSNSYHLNSYEELLVSNYINELNFFLSHTEQKMDSIINNARFLSTNPDIKYILTTSEIPIDGNISPYISALKSSIDFTNIVDSVAIYNKKAGFVISSQNLYTADEYFNNVNSYVNYSYDYWLNYHAVIGNIKILDPTPVTTISSPSKKNVVPLVFASLDNISSNSLVIFNIDVDSLIRGFETHKLTPNTKIYIKDNARGNIYSTIANAHDISNSTLLHTIKESLHSNTCVILHENEKFLLIQSTERSNYWGCTYFVSIPYSDIDRSTTKIFTTSLIFMALLTLGLLIYIIYGCKILYKPWKKIAHTAKSVQNSIDSNSNSTENIADYVSTTILDISNINKNLSDTLKTTLPLSQEKHLIDILNDNLKTNDTNNLLEPLSFKYDYFMSIAISIKINSSYFTEQHISVSSADVQKQIYKALHSFFSKDYITYELPVTNNIYYILLNVENEDCLPSIMKTIDEIKKMLLIDNDNLEIIFATGNIYRNIDGLKQTHHEAVSSMLKNQNQRKIQFSNVSSNKYIFSSSSENILTNYITIGATEKSKAFLANIFTSMQYEPPETRKKIYEDIVITFRKIMHRKGLPEADSATEYILHIVQQKDDIQDIDIQTDIFNLSDSISEKMHTNSKTVDIEEIVAYINEHYTENLYLEELADKFNTTAKYLSKRIGMYLNISFKEYITQLKINKAKTLLETSSTNISDLCVLCGFYDRGAFTRSFKMQTGMTPSEYKKHFKGNNNS